MNTRITISSLILLIILGISLYGWSNLALELSPYWGYITLENNPLLPDKDQDFKSIKAHKNRVPLNELLPGGPPKDGVPAIDHPKFVDANKTRFKDNELIIGVYLHGEARAYPYSILNWHEIVNDKIGKTPIAVTLCPLCDTNPVFIRNVNGIETTFGVSGKLYQSCLVMYDRLTDSLWAQPWGIAIVGSKVNDALQKVPAVKTTLGRWRKLHPSTKVLSVNTGYERNYFRYPYGDYYTNKMIIFPVRNLSQLQMHPKAIISYIWKADNKTPFNQFSGAAYSISHQKMAHLNQKIINFNGEQIKVIWDKNLKTVRFFKGNVEIPASTAFGFVYPAFFLPNPHGAHPSSILNYDN